MNIQIYTPDITIFSGEGDLIQLPGLDGSFEILNNHAPLIAGLKQGKIKVRSGDGTIQYFEIKGGVVEVLDNKILVLAE